MYIHTVNRQTHVNSRVNTLTDRCFQKRIAAPMFQPCVSYSAMNFNSRQKEEYNELRRKVLYYIQAYHPDEKYQPAVIAS